MKNIIVIYHSADFDGLFSREIAKKHFGDKADYIGWDYGQPVPTIPPDAFLYMIDISVDGLMEHEHLVWIDHHKSAMEKYRKSILGIQIDGVAACRLAWQYFFGDQKATKQAFIDRKVSEPLAVRLAGEYDIWDKRDPRAELFQHGLRSQDLTHQWPLLLKLSKIPSLSVRDEAESTGYPLVLEEDGSILPEVVDSLLSNGRSIQYAKTNENTSIITDYGFDVTFEGLTFLACNHARYNSHLFTAGIQSRHDALLGFSFDGKQWRISLYHAPGKEAIDLSLIAAKYGGGGHRGACGFKLNSIHPILKQS